MIKLLEALLISQWHRDPAWWAFGIAVCTFVLNLLQSKKQHKRNSEQDKFNLEFQRKILAIEQNKVAPSFHIKFERIPNQQNALCIIRNCSPLMVKKVKVNFGSINVDHLITTKGMNIAPDAEVKIPFPQVYPNPDFSKKVTQGNKKRHLKYERQKLTISYLNDDDVEVPYPCDYWTDDFEMPPPKKTRRPFVQGTRDS